MSNRFVTFLDAIGHAFKTALDKILPFAQVAAAVMTPVLPGIGAALTLTLGVVAQTEQKFAAMGQQSGTGAQKLADAMVILEPALSQMLAVSGKAADSQTVTNYINAVVALLNAIPAAQAPAPAK